MDLMGTERDGIANAMTPHLTDIRAMFVDAPDDATLIEWLQWAYVEMCNGVRDEFDRPIEASEVPY